jgi:class II lanthipeptide synthase
MSSFLRELQSLVRSFRVHNSSTFTLWGQRHDLATTTDDTGLVRDATHEASTHLSNVLYSRLHCRVPIAAEWGTFTDWIGARDFTDRLSEANCGRGTWQAGWAVRDNSDNGRVIVEHHDIRFSVATEDVRTVTNPQATEATAFVRLPKEYREWTPGFYFALGDADDVCDIEPLVRLYWHIRRRGAVRLTASVTETFNRAGMSFQFKIVNDPLRFHRADAAVLYLPRRSYGDAAPLVRSVYREARPDLRTPVSAYAKQLAPGLAVAEDPGDGSSFGHHRSRIIASALVSPASLAATSDDERIDAVVDCIRAAAVDPNALQLDTGSIDAYPQFPDDAYAN